VQREINGSSPELPFGMARVSTELAGTILVADSLDHACEFVNRFAPEHLSLPEHADKLLLKSIRSGLCLSDRGERSRWATMRRAATTSFQLAVGRACAAGFRPRTL